ncbi:MAG: ThiF family adenylyltransferase [Anaerolineae bacterium]|nr:ThiF family adenylyltransferase [Anaerolineae bacterium]
MDYTLALTRDAAETLQKHLLGDRNHEQMAVTLCGVNRLHHEVRLLTRDVILLPPDAFRVQSAVQLEVKPEVQALIHRRAAEHGLIQVDWHSHPGNSSYIAFSAVDDRYEAAQAAYLAHRLGGVPYGSVVINDRALDARLWLTERKHKRSKEGMLLSYHPEAHQLQAVFVGDLQRRIPASVARLQRAALQLPDVMFDRQVRAFGRVFQEQLGALRVGIVGLGAIGGSMVEYLARLGVRAWVLVDPDTVALSNLNRLINATLTDAQKQRPKVNVARSTIRQVAPEATVRVYQTDVFDPEAQRALKRCDLLIAATDNHSSRMALNRLAVQYLIPLVHLGFNIDVAVEPKTEERVVTDVSGEFAIPDLGRWCLQCAGLVDAQQAGWELATPAQRAILRERGYVADTPAPAVHHLDGLVAALATAEIHNLIQAFKPRQRYLVYDALKTELLPLQVTPSSTCPVCSPDHGVLGLGDLEPLPDYRRMAQVQLPPLLKDQAQAPAATDPTASGALEPAFQLATPQPDRLARTRRLQEAFVEAGDDED